MSRHVKAAPLTKNEVLLLMNLIDSYKVILSKGTNASENRLKEVAWRKVTYAFNAKVPSHPRRPEQLRLKWENLKKSARKRASIMTQIDKNNAPMNQNKILDRVIAMLNTSGASSLQIKKDVDSTDEDTCDAEEKQPNKVIDNRHNVCEAEEIQPMQDFAITTDEEDNCGEQLIPKFAFTTVDGGACEAEIIPPTQKSFSSMPIEDSGIEKPKPSLYEEDVKARIARNRAMAMYYTLKRKKVMLDIENLQLQNKKLRLEIKTNLN